MKNIKLAVDLGTTSIDMCLLSFEGDVVAQRSIKNRQSLYGRDVINRILSTVRDNKFLKIMKDMVLDDIVASIGEMLIDISADERDITYGCICGNTTMISILLEYDITTMGYYPFKTVLKESVETGAVNIFGNKIKNDFPLILSGCASAFIGGDIISGILYLKNTHNCFNDKDVSLLVDLGTNGEMVINNKGMLLATSTACGPAFEGSLKKQGVYGSSLIDSIVLGVKSGNISSFGILKDEYLNDGLRISNICITSDILREILSAKAAIRTGIDYLIKESNIAFDEIENLFIAGGFGKFLNINNALQIGLLPACLCSKIKVVGNTSLLGATLLLKDSSYIHDMDTYTKDKITVLQLADKTDYQNNLLNNMCFVRN